MPKPSSRKNQKTRSADPSRLPAFDRESPGHLVVIVETPKGSRNKYAYMPEHGVYDLRRVLPAGMTFPYDFGFIPSTKAGDGDPLDVLILMDEPAFPGCRLKCRVIGIIEGETITPGSIERNDRVIAVEQGNRSLAHVTRFDELGKQFAAELAEFFVKSHDFTATKFRVLGFKGPAAADRAIKKSLLRGRRQRSPK